MTRGTAGRVADGVWALPMALGASSSATSRSYLIDDGPGRFALIDPGWPSEGNWWRLGQCMRSLGAEVGDIALTFSTHAHRDHIGLADRIKRASGASITLNHAELTHVAEQRRQDWHARLTDRACQWGVPVGDRGRLHEQTPFDTWAGVDTEPLTLQPGDSLPLNDSGWSVHGVPGHTAGHACLVHYGRRIVMTGDHVLAGQSPGVGMGGIFHENPLEAMLRSLDAVKRFDGYVALPGHGSPFRKLEEASTAIQKHHLARRNALAQRARDDRYEPKDLTVWKLAQRIPWKGGFKTLRGSRLLLALAHVEIYWDHLTHEDDPQSLRAATSTGLHE